MPLVIVPAGLSMGPRYRYVRPPDPTPECYEVHLGDDLVELTDIEAAVWAAAFMDPEQHAKLKVNRNTLIHRLETAPKPVPQAPHLVDDLIARGLLVEFDPDGDLEPVFRRHKLLPLAQGLGSTPEAPHEHRLGLANQPILSLPAEAYGLWSFSFLHSDLWAACVDFADESDDEADGLEAMGLTAEAVARDLAVHLPLMIATSTAFLDAVVSP